MSFLVLIWPVVRQRYRCRCFTRQDHHLLEARLLRCHECEELQRPFSPDVVLTVKLVNLFVAFRVERRSVWYRGCRRCHLRLEGLDALHQDKKTSSCVVMLCQPFCAFLIRTQAPLPYCKPDCQCDDGPRHFLNTRGARGTTVCKTVHCHQHIYKCCEQELMGVTFDVIAQ